MKRCGIYVELELFLARDRKDSFHYLAAESITAAIELFKRSVSPTNDPQDADDPKSIEHIDHVRLHATTCPE